MLHKAGLLNVRARNVSAAYTSGARALHTSMRWPTNVAATLQHSLQNACSTANIALRSVPVVAQSKQTAADYQCALSGVIADKTAQPPGPASLAVASAVNGEQSGVVSAEGSGPGFVNIRLHDSWLLAHALRIAGVQSTAHSNSVSSGTSAPAPRKVLVDFGSPNMGKELHVGHLRSSVIGDTLANIFEWQLQWEAQAQAVAGAGQKQPQEQPQEQEHPMPVVDRVSHVGDLGLPVAIVLQEYLGPWSEELGSETWRASRAAAAVSGSSAGGWQWLFAAEADLLSGAITLPTPAELSTRYEQGKRACGLHPAKAAGAQAVLRALQAAMAAAQRPDLHSPLTPAQSTLLQAWRAICIASRRGYEPLFSRLNVRVREAGESSYAGALAPTVAALQRAGLAVEDQGALVIFLPQDATAATAAKKPQPKQKPQSPPSAEAPSQPASQPPLIIRKADGGWLYATVDLAALHARLSAGYDTIVYVTDASQGPHFAAIFAAARAAGWVDAAGRNTLHPSGKPQPVSLRHASFGLVTGDGGKKLSSRDGTELTLARLLDAGVAAVKQVMAANNNNSNQEAGGSGSGGGAGVDDATAEAIATSAIRFYEVAHRRNTNYAFSFDKVLALKGNSAAYPLYATTRLATLRRQVTGALAAAGTLRTGTSDTAGTAVTWEQLITACRAAQGPAEVDGGPLLPSERSLCLTLLRLPEAVAAAAESAYPHLLAEYCLRLATDVHTFYEAARILPPGLKAADVAAMDSIGWAVAARRLALCSASDETLRECFRLLGVTAVDRM